MGMSRGLRSLLLRRRRVICEEVVNVFGVAKQIRHRLFLRIVVDMIAVGLWPSGYRQTSNTTQRLPEVVLKVIVTIHLATRLFLVREIVIVADILVVHGVIGLFSLVDRVVEFVAVVCAATLVEEALDR